MKILKCFVGLAEGMVITCDGIEHEGKLWIVSAWLEHPSEPIAIPERLIRFDNYPHQSDDGVFYQNILLPIPESALYGDVPPGIEYLDRPQNIQVDIHLIRGH